MGKFVPIPRRGGGLLRWESDFPQNQEKRFHVETASRSSALLPPCFVGGSSYCETGIEIKLLNGDCQMSIEKHPKRTSPYPPQGGNRLFMITRMARSTPSAFSSPLIEMPLPTLQSGIVMRQVGRTSAERVTSRRTKRRGFIWKRCRGAPPSNHPVSLEGRAPARPSSSYNSPFRIWSTE